MTERGVGKPWTAYEDSLLTQAVTIYGENDNWKSVALSIPGRTNKACRKRWLHSLSPNVKKTAWTPEEDQLLLSLYTLHSTKWSVIARHIPGRTDDACSKRYREALDPSLKRDDWTTEEDAKLLEAYSRLGGKWGQVGQELGRSGLGCRNRWRMLERKRTASAREAAARGEQPRPAADPPSVAQSSWLTPQQQASSSTSYWDGYVSPAALRNNEPVTDDVSVDPPIQYSPAHFLELAQTNGHNEETPFRYQQSTLHGTLPNSPAATHSSHSHDYFTTSFSPAPSISSLPPPNTLEAPSPTARQYESGRSFVNVTRHEGRNDLAPEIFHHDDILPTPTSPPAQHSSSPSPNAVRDDVARFPVDISISPASPSEAPSSPPPAADSSDELPDSHTTTDDHAPSDVNLDRPRAYYRTEAEKALSRKIVSRRHADSQRPTRPSSNLPVVTDATVLAYACGHRECWLDDQTTSKSAFATSKELSDHSKVEHSGDLGGSKPFRCGLAGCEKSWKSVNGLQYHLQISKVHFQQALSAHKDIVPPPPQPQPASGDEGAAEPASAGKPRKLHPCPHPDCGKQYKQLSGLRYHLIHGHTEELPMPTQLDVVPPALARLISAKSRVVQS